MRVRRSSSGDIAASMPVTCPIAPSLEGSGKNAARSATAAPERAGTVNRMAKTTTDGRGGPVLVIGAGPGVGAAVARRFGREGHPVGLVARNAERLARAADELSGKGIAADYAAADVRDPTAVRAAIDALEARLGAAEVLCVSPLPDVATIKPVADTTAEDLAAALELGVVGTAAAVGRVLGGMRAAGRGTLLFTTGSAALTPTPARAASGIVNAAQSVYFRMLERPARRRGHLRPARGDRRPDRRGRPRPRRHRGRDVAGRAAAHRAADRHPPALTVSRRARRSSRSRPRRSRGGGVRPVRPTG